MSRGRRRLTRDTPAPTPRPSNPEPFEVVITTIVRVEPGRNASVIIAPVETRAWLGEPPFDEPLFWELKEPARADEAMAELSKRAAEELQEEARRRWR